MPFITTPRGKTSSQWVWAMTPFLGGFIFILLYLIAASYYPGGSSIDPRSKGFSWENNYWCNLLNDRAINGQINHGQPIALTAMFILCFSLSAFWIQFPAFTPLPTYFKQLIRISGLLAMSIGALLFTKLDHDLITNLASFFGLLALSGTIMGLYKNGWKHLFYVGLFNIVLIALNNYLYYSESLRLYLPVVQKLTFLSFLIWIGWINLKMQKILH